MFKENRLCYKDPAVHEKIVLRNGGAIETEAGIALASVSDAGVVTLAGDITASAGSIGATELASTLNLSSKTITFPPLLSTVAGVFGTFIPLTAQQALSGAGAVNLTSFYTAVTNTGSDALTLADGTVKGQLKKVKMVVDPGTDSTLTFNGNATIVFADVGDYALLVWDGSDWTPIELGNDADGATAPAYTPAS